MPQHKTRYYESQVRTTLVQKGQAAIETRIVTKYRLSYRRQSANGGRVYLLETTERFFLTPTGRRIGTPNGVQKLALLVASVNDNLELELSKTYGLEKLINTHTIREKWQAVKAIIVEQHTDLKTMAEDFTFQLQEEHIQKAYRNDNFLNVFFAPIFNTAIDGITRPINIANALGRLSMPINVQTKLKAKRKLFSTKDTLELKGTIATEAINRAKLNHFLGQLPTQEGEIHNLEFNYKGHYKLDTELETIEEGHVDYTFSIGELYNNTTVLTFNLIEDEQ